MKSKTKDFYILIIVHLIIGGIATSLALSPGCTSEIEEKEAPLGKEVSADEVAEVIIGALSGKSLLVDEEIGAKILYENNLVVNTSQAQLRKTLYRELADRKEDKDNLRLVFNEVYTDYLSAGSGKPKPVQREVIIDIENFTSQIQENIKSLQYAPDSLSNSYISKQLLQPLNLIPYATKQGETKTTFHNLKVQRYTKDAPYCRNLPGCLQMNITEVAYNIAFWEDQKLTFRVRKVSEYSPDIPYLATPVSDFELLDLPVVSDCYKYIYQADGKKHFVSECVVLRNFASKN